MQDGVEELSHVLILILRKMVLGGKLVLVDLLLELEELKS
jgi:hypothetical protein